VKVSVIIPALNEAERIENAIERAWQAGADDVIVVDGASDDDTAARVANSHCRFVASARGRAVQQNFGAKTATGDVLLFLHADTWLPSGAVDQIRDALRQPGVVAGAFRQRIEARGLGYRIMERGNALRVRFFGRAYGDQGIFVRRDVFERVGGFPDEPFLEDLLLMRRLNRVGRPVLLPGPIHVGARRWQRRGLARQTLRNWAILAAHWLGATPKSLARWYTVLAAYIATA
jgi:rSAM/selenodomain-associated transferase 2